MLDGLRHADQDDKWDNPTRNNHLRQLSKPTFVVVLWVLRVKPRINYWSINWTWKDSVMTYLPSILWFRQCSSNHEEYLELAHITRGNVNCSTILRNWQFQLKPCGNLPREQRFYSQLYTQEKWVHMSSKRHTRGDFYLPIPNSPKLIIQMDINREMDKLWYCHTVKYFTAIKMNTF